MESSEPYEEINPALLRGFNHVRLSSVDDGMRKSKKKRETKEERERRKEKKTTAPYHPNGEALWMGLEKQKNTLKPCFCFVFRSTKQGHIFQ